MLKVLVSPGFLDKSWFPLYTKQGCYVVTIGGNGVRKLYKALDRSAFVQAGFLPQFRGDTEIACEYISEVYPTFGELCAESHSVKVPMDIQACWAS